jgi:hypothetical protein
MVTLPEISLMDVALSAREVLGSETPTTELLKVNRVSFGRTDPLPLTPATPGIDDAVRTYLSDDPSHSYTVLGFTCSFRPDHEPIVETRLAIRLRPKDPGVGREAPVAWSLYPERLASAIKRTRQFTLSPKATFALEIGAELSHSEEFAVEDCYLIATGRGEPVAEWHFRRTVAVALEGMHDVRVIVRGLAGSPAAADIRMSAKIQSRLAGVIPYRATLPESLRTVPLPG